MEWSPSPLASYKGRGREEGGEGEGGVEVQPRNPGTCPDGGQDRFCHGDFSSYVL